MYSYSIIFKYFTNKAISLKFLQLAKQKKLILSRI